MKQILLTLGAAAMMTTMSYAQQDPAAANPTLTPSPLSGIGAQFDISFYVGNNGNNDITGASAGFQEKMRFTISPGRCAPSFNNAVSVIGTNALSGTALTYFDITYNAGTNTFLGTQKQGVALGIIPAGMHSITLHLQVTSLPSTPAANEIGATINVQPNANSIGNGNNQANDDINIFTHTSTILPVVLNGFVAKAEGCITNLEWSTATEENFSFFNVERSNGNSGFTAIGTLKAKGSNSNYTFTDKTPLQGINTYRLKMVDVDATTVYSDIQVARVNCATTKAINVYPNPANDYVNVSGLTTGQQLRIMDVSGRVLVTATSTGNEEKLNLNTLPAGLYLVQVIENGAVVEAVKFNKK